MNQEETLVTVHDGGMIQFGPRVRSPARAPRLAFYLDRDGTLIRHRAGHVRSVSDIEFLPGALAALRGLSAADVAIAVISNQSSVSRGLLSVESLIELHVRFLAGVAAAGGRIDVSFLCPHQPSDGCGCRKPRLGMYQAAARELGCERAAAVVVGDAPCDIDGARGFGAQPVLVRTGLGEVTRDEFASAGTLDDCRVFPAFADAVEDLWPTWS
jgi:D-glycero-D-manno-heptose 1,7-bisphosphate phosphatase